MIETFGGQLAAEAGDGMTAITEYERTHPDIVLMDITMPQMEGIEAAEKSYATSRGSHCDGVSVAIRKTSWPHCNAARAISCRSRSNRKFCTRSSSMFWAKMEPWPPAQEPKNEMELIQPSLTPPMRCWRKDCSLRRRLGTSAWTKRPTAARELPRSFRSPVTSKGVSF